jgi:tetratricopeptide (TPR) repeat protein
MAHPSKRSHASNPPQGSVLAMLAERSQLDFELAFYAGILGGVSDYADVLRVYAQHLASKGMLKEGLMAEQKLVQLRPADPDAHYNLACRYATLRQPDLALRTLRTAVELGYRDFRAMVQERQLESVRKDPRFRALLREYQA